MILEPATQIGGRAVCWSCGLAGDGRTARKSSGSKKDSLNGLSFLLCSF